MSESKGVIAHTRWPVTKATDFCGDHIPMEAPVPDVNEHIRRMERIKAYENG